MAREVTISLWCDACKGESGDRVEATETETLTIGGQTRVLDLCEPHRDKITGQIREWLSWGAKPDAQEPPRRGERIACPLCSYAGPSRDGLGKHARQVHKLSGLKELLATTAPAESGGQASLLPKVEGPELPHICEVCGAAYSMAKGLGVHRRYSHGIIGASTLAARERAAKAS